MKKRLNFKKSSRIGMLLFVIDSFVIKPQPQGHYYESDLGSKRVKGHLIRLHIWRGRLSIQMDWGGGAGRETPLGVLLEFNGLSV